MQDTVSISSLTIAQNIGSLTASKALLACLSVGSTTQRSMTLAQARALIMSTALAEEATGCCGYDVVLEDTMTLEYEELPGMLSIGTKICMVQTITQAMA